MQIYEESPALSIISSAKLFAPDPLGCQSTKPNYRAQRYLREMREIHIFRSINRKLRTSRAKFSYSVFFQVRSCQRQLTTHLFRDDELVVNW